MSLPINIEELVNGDTIEWDRIELKMGWNPQKVIHTMCAFANDISNWGGGYIIIGIEEKDGIANLTPKGIKKKKIDYLQKKLVELSHKTHPYYSPISQPY